MKFIQEVERDQKRRPESGWGRQGIFHIVVVSAESQSVWRNKQKKTRTREDI